MAQEISSRGREVESEAGNRARPTLRREFMALELRQQLRLTQQLVMTPQLQQAIKLLQLNQLELVNLVQQELQENPVLEESDIEEETQAEREDATPEDYDQTSSESSAPTEDRTETPAASESPPTDEAAVEGVQALDEQPVLGDEVAPSDAEKIADIEWESYLESNPMTGLDSRGMGDDDRPSIEATYARRQSLAEHLEWQLHVTDLDPAGIEIGVLAAIQRLDPVGVAARDLRECLLLQIDTLKIGDELVRRVVDEHLDLLQKRDFRSLTRVTGATIQEIGDATQVIGDLEPRPGRGFGNDDPVYITPDIYVYKVGDDFHVMLNEDGTVRRAMSILADLSISAIR